MSMMQPLSGDNSVLGIRGIGVYRLSFTQFDQMKSDLSSKEMTTVQFSGSLDGHWFFAIPMTPQATRAPESPEGWVFRSSAFA
jgi:hypothetical protein